MGWFYWPNISICTNSRSYGAKYEVDGKGVLVCLPEAQFELSSFRFWNKGKPLTRLLFTM